MIYIFAPSYQTILFALHQFKTDEITLVTRNKSINDLAKKTGIAVIYREMEEDLSLKGYRNYKKYCLEMIKGWEGRDILFCFYSYDIWSLYQLVELREKNNVYFYNTDVLSAPGFDEANSVHFPTKNNSLTGLFNKKYRRILFRQKLLYSVTGFSFDIIRFEKDNYGLGITLERIRKTFLPFKKKFSEAILLKNREIILASVKLPPAFDILYIDSGAEETEYPKELTDSIKEFVKQHNLTLFVKPHPTFELPEGWSDFPKVDKSIPVELFEGVPKIVMGLASTAMIDMVKSTFTVSLINLAKFELVGSERIFRKILGFEEKIHTPATIEELKDMLRKETKK